MHQVRAADSTSSFRRLHLTGLRHRNNVYLGKITHAEALHAYVLASCAGREDLAHEAFGAAKFGRYEDLDEADLLKLSSADHIRLVRTMDGYSEECIAYWSYHDIDIVNAFLQ